MLRRHRPLLMNYFKARKQFSSGVVEGLNNKAKVTLRRSYGFRTFRVLELALYHTLGKLPEPELTHEFFLRASRIGTRTQPMRTADGCNNWSRRYSRLTGANGAAGRKGGGAGKPRN